MLGTPLEPPFPEGKSSAVFGLGCFWGAEREFWKLDGAYITAVGYAGGFTPNPTYREVCSGRTGHAEVVLVVFDPERVSYRELLRVFWAAHETRRRGCARATTQARSTARRSTTQATTSVGRTGHAEETRDAYEEALRRNGYGPITTEIAPAGEASGQRWCINSVALDLERR